MISLRRRLWIGFGGVLLILAVVCILSINLVERYNNELDLVMRENYDSITYCDEMRAALHRLHESAIRAQVGQGKPLPASELDDEFKRFDATAQLQIKNSYLPGERDAGRRIVEHMAAYRDRYLTIQQAASRPVALDDQLELHHQAMMSLLEQVSRMNAQALASVKSTLRDVGRAARDTVLFLGAIGLLAPVVYISIVASSMLSQLNSITESAEHIAGGDLEATVPVRSQDEFGKLAARFNLMAAKLREFRRAEEDRLTRSRRSTQLAIDSLLEPVLVADPRGGIEIANHAARRLLGIQPGQSVNNTERWLADLHTSVMTGQAPAIDGYRSAIQVFDQGQELFLLPRAVPMADESGQTIGVTIILMDVTQLRHADELKSGLLSTVSHELRTPLTGLQMSVNLLQEPAIGDLNAKQRELVDVAVVSSERLFRVIDHLLSISRIESGKLPLQLQAVSPAELVQHAVDAHREALQQNGIELRVELPEGLPLVNVDPATVHYVFTNLLSNARKYTPAGGAVRVSAIAEPGVVVFSIADTGPGIPAEYRQRVFDKFFRIPTPSGPTGAGLGLSIAQEIVLAHGGAISVAEAPSGGSDFRFTLPRSDPESA